MRLPLAFAVAALCVMAGPAHAGTDVPVRGDDPETRVIQIDNASTLDNSALVYVFTQDELVGLPPGAVITGLELDKLDDATSGPNTGDLQIFLANTTETVASFGLNLGQHKAGSTMVYQSSAQAIPATTGWFSLGAFNGPAFTYAGQGLKVIVVWSADDFPAAPALKMYNRPTLRLAGHAPDLTTAGRQLELPVADSDSLFTAPRRPNTRFTFTPTASPWLVLVAGFNRIVPGASYANTYAFAAGVSVPQHFQVINNGGAAADLSAGLVFSGVSGVNLVATTPPPASLAAGASADVTLTQTGTSSGAGVEFTTTVGTVGFTQTGTVYPTGAASPYALMWFLENDRVSDLIYGVPLRESLVDEVRDFTIRVFSGGAAPVEITSVEITDGAGIATSIPLPATISVPAGEEHDLAGTYTCTSTATATSTIWVHTTGGSRQIYLACTGVTPIEAPPAGTRDLAVSWSREGGEGGQIADGGTDTLTRVDLDAVTLTLRNTGTAPLSVSSIDLFGANLAAELVPAPTFPIVIAPNGETSVVMEVDLDPGDAEAEVQVELTSNDDDDPTLLGSFVWPAAGPDLVVAWFTDGSPREVQPEGGGDVFTGDDLGLVLRNVGTGTLVITNVLQNCGDDCYWSVDPTFPIEVPPGEAFVVEGTIDADDVDAQIAITVVSNDTDVPEYTIYFYVEPAEVVPPGGGGGGGGCQASSSPPFALIGLVLALLALAHSGNSTAAGRRSSKPSPRLPANRAPAHARVPSARRPQRSV